MCTSPPIGSPDVLWMWMEMIQDGPDLMRRSGTNQQLGGHPCHILKQKPLAVQVKPENYNIFVVFDFHCLWATYEVGLHLKTRWPTCLESWCLRHQEQNSLSCPRYTIGSFAQTKICQYHIAIFKKLQRIVS